MREVGSHEEMEKALLRLMPAALSGGAQTAMEDRIDGLAGGGGEVRKDFSRWARLPGGIAAVLVIGVFAVHKGTREVPPTGKAAKGGVIILTETDRVENFRDEGLFVDAGGSAVRKLRVRVVGESRVRDAETGIEVMLTEPREEMVLLPVSNF